MYDDELQNSLIAAAIATAAYLGVNLFVAWSIVDLNLEACANLLYRGIGAIVILAVVWISCGRLNRSRFRYFTSSVLAMTWYCWWPTIKKSAETMPCFHDICDDYGLRWWGQPYIGVGTFILILAASIFAIKAWEER